MPDEQCPICSRVLRKTPQVHENYDAKIYDCPQCGRYILEELTDVNSDLHNSKQLISAWIRRQNRRGIRPFIGNGFFEEEWFKNLNTMGFPKNVPEKLDALLRAYADLVKDNYNEIIKVHLEPKLVSDIAAKDLDEIKGLNRFLLELDYIEKSTNISTPETHVRLTAKGWQHIAELNKSISSSDSVFIAMWFDTQTNSYREAVKEVVTACGYNPVIVDDTKFNDFIMDVVITQIRQARFLIADLTCISETVNTNNSEVKGGVRGGVYWEAGMAYGMGKTVIQTRRDDDCSLKRVHFDLNQYKTIIWEEGNLTTEPTELFKHVDNPSFTQKLAQHITATVGKGSYVAVSE